MKKMTPFWMRVFVACFAIVIAITLLTSTIFICMYWSNNKKYHEDSMENTMQYSKTVLENYFERYTNVVGNMGFAEQVYELQNSESIPYYSRNQQYNRLLSNCFPAMNDADLVCLYTNDGYVTRLGKNVSLTDADGLLHEKCKQFCSEGSGNEFWVYNSGYIVMCRDIVYIDSQYVSTYLGYLLVYIDVNKVNEECFGNFNNTTYEIMYSDPLGNVAVASNKSVIGKKIADVKDIKSDASIECTRPKMWTCYGYSEVMASFSGTQKFIIFIFAIDLVGIAIMYALLDVMIKKMSNPMDNLLEVAKGIRQEKNDESSEIEYIRKTIEELEQNLKAEIENNYQMNERAKIAAVKAYESQVNPHFLNNTLQMIEMMSVIGDTKKIPIVTRSLGNMFRFSMDVENEVKISQEIENSEDYFKILKMRFGDSFDYKILIDDSLKDYMCPKFVIQPFAENAATHAYDNKDGKLNVVVTALAEFDNIVIIVKDNGNGIPKEKLAEIKRNLADREYNSSKHIGIKNVHERVKLLYGDDYGVEILSNKFGTQVMINIPLRKGD